MSDLSQLFFNDSLEEHTFCFGKDGVITIEGYGHHLQHEASVEGQQVWEGAVVLANVIHETPKRFEGKRVLELGSGAGLCGILVSKYASSTILSDYDEGVLSLLKENVERNKAFMGESKMPTCISLEWNTDGTKINHPELQEGFDIVIASDVIYKEEAIAPFLFTAKELLSRRCKQGSSLILANGRMRLGANYKVFMEQVDAAGFSLEELEPLPFIPKEQIIEGRRPPCLLFELKLL